jgi:hypothetical protein
MSHVSTIIAFKMWGASWFSSIEHNYTMKRQSIAAGMCRDVLETSRIAPHRYNILYVAVTGPS